MTSLNDRRLWNFEDLGPEIPLDSIESVSARAEALVRRSQSPLLEQHFLQVAGALPMLAGIDYHRDQFVAAIRRLSREDSRSFAAIRHEAVAWVNRVGQFDAFARSSLVRERLGRRPTPALDAVRPFRNKHTHIVRSTLQTKETAKTSR